ncbi:hypothetical protein A0H81_10242 [Grifola frondosa]|uniref:Uncharacterized protein n=1 Tax=Grifola frondosa TaxID=5627 RepID=A0A1C7LZK4_GRIFR|nr:hypothetical protein A0H81_10242 [Grifola frondosa]
MLSLIASLLHLVAPSIHVSKLRCHPGNVLRGHNDLGQRAYAGIQTVLGRLVIPRGVVKITAPSSPMFVSADWELLVTCSVMLGHLRDQTLHSAPSLAPLRLRRGYRSPDSGMGYDLSDSETIHATTQECVGRMKDEGEEEEEEEEFMSAHAVRKRKQTLDNQSKHPKMTINFHSDERCESTARDTNDASADILPLYLCLLRVALALPFEIHLVTL